MVPRLELLLPGPHMALSSTQASATAGGCFAQTRHPFVTNHRSAMLMLSLASGISISKAKHQLQPLPG